MDINGGIIRFSWGKMTENKARSHIFAGKQNTSMGERDAWKNSIKKIAWL